MDGVTLLAMAPSGEVLLARDAVGQVWLIRPEGAGRPEVIDEELAERGIAEHGFHRVDREFTDWRALDDFRQERAAAVAPAIVVEHESLDLEDVQRLLKVGRRWIAEGNGPRARRLAFELLRVPAVRVHEESHDDVVSLLEKLDRAPVQVRSTPATELQSAARARWREVVAA